MKTLLLLLVFIAGYTVYGQPSPGKDTVAVNTLLSESKALISTDSAKAISLATQAKDLAKEIEFPKGEAFALKNIGMVYYLKGMYGETLDYWNQSLQIFETI